MHRPIESVLPDHLPSAAPRTVPGWLRSKGAVDLSFRTDGERLALGRTAQSGCMRARFPRRTGEGETHCAVLINTSGGVADGDRIDHAVEWGEDTFATVTTQAAEKVYRALAAGSVIETRLNVARGARAEWLPQETILFDGARLRREARIVLAEDVTFLGVEAVVFGRQAMGETLRRGALTDRLRIWRNDRLIYADTVRFDGEVEALMQHAAIGGGASAMAVVVHACTRADTLLGPVREALAGAKGLCAASCWNGLLAVRLLAHDGASLRSDISLALSVLREGRPLPRVWRC